MVPSPHSIFSYTEVNFQTLSWRKVKGITLYNDMRRIELLCDDKAVLPRVTTQYNDLETDEINILTGALRLKQKCVKVN